MKVNWAKGDGRRACHYGQEWLEMDVASERVKSQKRAHEQSEWVARSGEGACELMSKAKRANEASS